MNDNVEMTGWADPEFAEAGRSREFPEEWGLPVGRQFSEERAEWIRNRVRAHTTLTAHRTLANKQGRLLSILRRAELGRHREGH
jgi:hypothetical protein